MAQEQEVKLKDCFGTFDNSDPTRGCQDCDDSGKCELFKPILAEHKAKASKQGVSAYINASTQERQIKTGKFVAYTITLAILALVLWQAAQSM